MAFTARQTKSLKAKLKYRHVKVREIGGASISYLEGWHMIAEANRIFGFDSWDRQTLSPHCHWTKQQSGDTICFYSTKVRITVRAGDTVTVREGLGTGLGRSLDPEIAHEIAIKASETDATKRALATFGNPFGLALYDRDLSHVTRARRTSTSTHIGKPPSRTYVLIDVEAKEVRFADSEAFVAAAQRQIDALKSIDSLYAFWSRNAAEFGKLRIGDDKQSDTADKLVDALRNRAREIGQSLAPLVGPGTSPTPEAASPAPGSFLIPKEKRIRDPVHLAFVASEPCMICGRRPAQAHHLRFAQPRAMALKVSDEFTVPLCNTHHDQLHRSGDERRFWTQNGFKDPLQQAERYWDASQRQRLGSAPRATIDPDLEEEFNEPTLNKRS